MSKKSKRRKTKEESMELIRATTLRLIKELGYAKTSVNNIAKESGINIGLLYRYFPNGKPEILRNIGFKFMSNISEEINMNTDGDLYTILKNILQNYLALHLQHRSIIKALSIAYLSNKEIFTQDNISPDSIQLQYYKYMVDIVEKFGREKGMPPQKIALLIMLTVDRMVHYYTLYEPKNFSEIELLEFLVEMIREYILYEKK
ncbi:MAG: TetR/AcrR family transcriptional regulator [Promethearchaeota archaeon]